MTAEAKPVEVTQADRKAALRYHGSGWMTDLDRLAEAFARHRLATRPTPSSDMVEAPRPYPHATGEGTKYQECYSFDDGSLTIRTTGYGERSGTGWLCFPEDALEQEQDDENGKWYQVANLANSELIFLRDTLNTIFPEAMAAKDAELAELRAEIEALRGALERLADEHTERDQVEVNEIARAALGSAEG